MNNRTCLRIIIEDIAPYFVIKGTSENYKVIGTGIPFLDSAAKKHGFCYSLHLPKERLTFGRLMENGSFSGPIGDVQKGLYDLFGGNLLFTPNRCKYLDCGTFVAFNSHSAFYRTPKVEPDLSGFLKPITYQGWLLTLVMLILTVIGLFCIQKVSKMMDRDTFIMSPTNIMLEILQILLGQGRAERQLLLSRKILYFWLSTTMFLGFIYKCNLRALLIAPKTKQPFHDIHELVQQDRYVWQIVKGSVLENIARKAEVGSSLRKVYEGKGGYITNINESIHKALNSDATLLSGYELAMALISEHHKSFGIKLCDSSFLKEPFLTTTSGMLFTKGSIWKDKFDKLITVFQEAGLFQFLERPFNKYRTRCTAKNMKKATGLRPLSLADFYGVFYLYGTGLFLSLMAFLLEKKF